MPQGSYNIALIGKTGTGKSTLINYLFGVSLARTGTGAPVTARGFHPYDLEIFGLAVRIYDSWGLEADKAEQWLLELKTELGKRGTDRPAEDWFHTIFYCINAGGHRVEPYDANIIKQFLGNNYQVTVILTKADLAGADQLDQLIQTIRQEAGPDVPVIAVCAEEKELKGGRRVLPFGRTEVFGQIIQNFWTSICQRLPQRCVKVLDQIITAWQQKQLAVLAQVEMKQAQEQVIAEAEELETQIKEGLFEQAVLTELRSAFAMYRQFNATLDCFPEGRELRVLPAFPEHKPSVLRKFSFLAGPVLGAIAYAAMTVVEDRLSHSRFIAALNTYCDKLRQEAEKLGPEIAALLEQQNLCPSESQAMEGGSRLGPD